MEHNIPEIIITGKPFDPYIGLDDDTMPIIVGNKGFTLCQVGIYKVYVGVVKKLTRTVPSLV